MQSKYVIDTRGNEVIVLKYRGTLNINGVETDEFVIVINDNKDLSHSIEVIEAGEDELLSYEKYFNTFEELCKDIGIECIPNNWIDENNNSGSKYIYTPEQVTVEKEEKQRKSSNMRIVKEIITTEREVADTELGENTLDRIEEILLNVADKIKNKSEQDIKYKIPSFEFTRKEIMGVDINNILDIIDIDNTLLITSEPGTGKSTLARELAYLLTCDGRHVEYGQKDIINRTLALSFSSETSYVDTIGGARCNNGIWSIKDGYLKKFFDAAASDLEHKYVVIMDEINRVSDISSVLGEIISAMEQRDVYITTNIGTELMVPSNVVFLATMNTFDTSVINLDRAIKDRFSLFEMSNIVVKAEYIKPEASDELKDALQRCLNKFTEINNILAKHHMIKSENKVGLRHFYKNYNDIHTLGLVIEHRVIPQILGNTDGLEDYDINKISKLIDELREIYKEHD